MCFTLCILHIECDIVKIVECVAYALSLQPVTSLLAPPFASIRNILMTHV